MPALAYFITFHTYGTWLHGRDEGSVDRDHNRPGTPLFGVSGARENWEHNQRRADPFVLNEEHRWVVDRTVRDVTAFRGWSLHALHVRTTHVHTVITASTGPERVMDQLKAYATRQLRGAGVVGADAPVWSRHGSTRWLNDANKLEEAVNYVRDGQGDALPMVRPRGWRPIGQGAGEGVNEA